MTSMLLALTIAPALLGTQESIRQSQSQNKKEEHRARRCNLVVSCVQQSIRSHDVDGKLVVLKDGKLWITTTPPPSHDDPEPEDTGYPFSGYFLPYPDTEYEGLVSTISYGPPVLNWIYVDKNTYEVKYGLRTEAQPHITGPFDCTRQDRRMTMDGWEGFAAVETYPGVWALYFDRDDNGLYGKVPMGTRVLEVELTRREKKERKPEPDPNQARTLDAMMVQHKAEYAKQEEEKNEFLNTGEIPEQSATSNENHNNQSGDAARRSLAERVERMSLDFKTSVTSRQPMMLSPRTPRMVPPSTAASDNFSYWSSDRRHDDATEVASVTATTVDIDGLSDVATQDNQDAQDKKSSADDAANPTSV
ncbi:hypothetical protein F4808DRAFT_453922 [Astrocystis sublimbata]|nr:hypothetical protein F4808DRAFT_453922 [Astrocystis sublimbata]